MSGQTEEGPRFVLDAANGTYYPEEAFISAFGDAFVGHVAAAIPEGSTPRRAARAVRNMRNPTAHAAVLKQAIGRLRNTEGVTSEEVSRSGGSVVATFAV